ncbi:hypothetical protein EYW49_13090 [Siculibacillus lacustris]|uniref:Dehydratase n=1 Tax=Siculibacillus lacustris TaxID=1549641 RepID=A0A4Q9VPD9_9HYPH|nr:glycerol dehydratase reactivase beta/small subunit family protein [Siculibacillus lacustris]TBW36772.1 hypothetical protein EYW49_13090 [Siculibacillus lacustris]
MAEPGLTRPTINVATLDPTAAELYRWIEFGAEEEGVPTRRVTVEATEVVAAAYEAARGSSFGIGVALSADRIALHEGHMPPERAVLDAPLAGDRTVVCRRFGSNAARMVVRLPLRLTEEPETVAAPVVRRPPVAAVAPTPDIEVKAEDWTEDRVTRIAAIVAGLLKERGVL